MTKFKVLIAYDGSSSSDAALDDLKKAGLPESGVEALLLSVAEVWLPPQDSGETDAEFITAKLREKYQAKLQIFNEAQLSSQNAAERLRSMFPGWSVESEATYGSPGWEIVSYAEKFKADLIVVGAKGLSAIDRILLGSISQKVVTEANCSVRVARGKIETDHAPARILVGYDGTSGAREAVREITERHWESGAQFKVVIVEDSYSLRSTLEIEQKDLEKSGGEIVRTLQNAGLDAELFITEGNPKKILVDEADRWDADGIFIGAAKFDDFLTKHLLGSVASAIVTRASCSVEVVRPSRS